MPTRQRSPRNASLLVDVEVVETLRLEGWHGPLCRAFRVSLDELAVGRLTALDRTNELFGEVQRAGPELDLPVPDLYWPQAKLIIRETADVASRRFVDVDILQNVWSADDGVPLHDSFILTCYCTFADRYNDFCHKARGGGD